LARAEQSLKCIESAGERASGGLKGLGRQAELLRAGVRTLGVALVLVIPTISASSASCWLRPGRNP
jgi:hypothetical protein